MEVLPNLRKEKAEGAQMKLTLEEIYDSRYLKIGSTTASTGAAASAYEVNAQRRS